MQSTPSHVIRAFIREEISNEAAAAPRNDGAPILGIFLELVSLKRIYLVADDAGNRHWYPLMLASRFGRSSLCTERRGKLESLINYFPRGFVFHTG